MTDQASQRKKGERGFNAARHRSALESEVLKTSKNYYDIELVGGDGEGADVISILSGTEDDEEIDEEEDEEKEVVVITKTGKMLNTSTNNNNNKRKKARRTAEDLDAADNANIFKLMSQMSAAALPSPLAVAPAVSERDRLLNRYMVLMDKAENAAISTYQDVLMKEAAKISEAIAAIDAL
mmetsp:Transcript_16225/g.33332  ORF Transcript_16225/g.33332 Transcript_16225/m.33332 type:complete len:181 (+) Transcript_16225:420-962(+)|eukprot:CAMPEP_0118650382 /NCGR_PEP_ID=MMETSP0785-20121206/10219_1 /TAXON_ID=91992 /ORGANISM="Bolidomonas pacifica, Strain CCMP 1866" /LENGTH=180 /DNA_ID=CAMNT_0006542757 /DNA_START=369 /DNA_END=911 /DNA_ORIENTATION=+